MRKEQETAETRAFWGVVGESLPPLRLEREQFLYGCTRRLAGFGLRGSSLGDPMPEIVRLPQETRRIRRVIEVLQRRSLGRI